MTDRVVSHDNASRHQTRYDCIITAIIYFLLGVKEAKAYVFAFRQKGQGIPIN